MKANKLIDLVLAQHKSGGRYYLFQAPSFSFGISEGAIIIVETANGDQMAKVVSRTTVTEEGTDYNIILTCAGATVPLKKVLAIVTPIDWEAD